MQGFYTRQHPGWGKITPTVPLIREADRLARVSSLIFPSVPEAKDINHAVDNFITYFVIPHNYSTYITGCKFVERHSNLRISKKLLHACYQLLHHFCRNFRIYWSE
ncbi:hypothetical protein NNRS527_01385 [Nitrosospira sp. NRS527]|nr:hypothetical protein NNRS527_01385 [Nitrosospira sp. NRS527]